MDRRSQGRRQRTSKLSPRSAFKSSRMASPSRLTPAAVRHPKASASLGIHEAFARFRLEAPLKGFEKKQQVRLSFFTPLHTTSPPPRSEKQRIPIPEFLLPVPLRHQIPVAGETRRHRHSSGHTAAQVTMSRHSNERDEKTGKRSWLLDSFQKLFPRLVETIASYMVDPEFCFRSNSSRSKQESKLRSGLVNLACNSLCQKRKPLPGAFFG